MKEVVVRDAAKQTPFGLLRAMACAVGLVTVLPLGLLLWLAMTAPVTFVSVMYLAGGALAVLGAITAPWRAHRGRGVLRAGLALLALVAGARLLFTGGGDAVSMITLPGGGRARWIDRLIPEQDVTLFAARLLKPLGLASATEVDGLPEALHGLHREMRRVQPNAPSPFAATYLGLQSPRRFDAVVVEPAQGAPAVGVVFLHGYAGNFAVQCWMVARAARAAGVVTVCPSTGASGAWWRVEGAETLRLTLDYLHQRGIRRIYLAGLSNGGVGASRLAAQVAPQISGLILISGLAPDAPLPPVPVLLVHGAGDERMPVGLARERAAGLGGRATYVELPGDHFVLAKEADAIRDAIAAWLRQQEP